MTVLVGVLCQDGVVVGSDGSGTFSTSGNLPTIEQPVQKTFIVGDDVIFAATGADETPPLPRPPREGEEPPAAMDAAVGAEQKHRQGWFVPVVREGNRLPAHAVRAADGRPAVVAVIHGGFLC